MFELQIDKYLIYFNYKTFEQINDHIKENISKEQIWLALADYDFYIDIKFELDLYTGSLSTKTELLNLFLSDGQAEELADLSGFSFNAECKKLEEKLF